MSNTTYEAEVTATKELVKFLNQYGFKLGQKAKFLLDNDMASGSTIRLDIFADEIRNIKPSVPFVTTMFSKFGTSDAAVVANGAIVVAGIYTAGNSAIQFNITQNPLARGLYTASALFSTSAVTSGSMAVIARACKVSEIAMFSEAFGAGFMILGNIAHVRALELEGKPVPQHLKRFTREQFRAIRQPRYNSNLGFIMPGENFSCLSEIIAAIPFEKIGRVVGFSISVYGYYKMIVLGYRYSQKLIAKYNQNRRKTNLKNGLITKQAQFVVVSFCYNPAVRKKLLFANNDLQVSY